MSDAAIRCPWCGTAVTPGQLIGNTLANGAMPAMVKQSVAAMRLHTAETDQLRKRVAELESELRLWREDVKSSYLDHGWSIMDRIDQILGDKR